MDITIQTTTMSDVIDIIHRLSYNVDTADLEKAGGSISKQIVKVKELEAESRALAVEFTKTAATEIAKRDEIIKKINANKVAVKQLNDEVTESVLTSKELQAALQKEQGVIGSLNTQLDLLKKKRDAATDPAVIQRYNKQIADINSKVKTLSLTQGAGGGNATGAILGLNNIIRDAPFGVIGVSNNITQLTDNFAQLKKQTGSTGSALKVFLSGLTGAGGIALGISAVTSLLTFLTMKYGSLDGAIKALFGTMSEAEKYQQKLTDSLEGANKEYEKAYTNVAELRNNIELAKNGFIDKDKVVKEYNETIGKTIGAVKTLDEAEQQLAKNAEAYIQFTLLKAAANQAQEAAAKKAFEAETTRRKKEAEFSTTGDALILPSQGVTAPGFVPGQQDAQRLAAQALKQRAAERKAAKVKEAEDERKEDEDIAKKFYDDAATLAKKYGFDFLGGLFDDKGKNGGHSPENVFAQRLQALKARLAAITDATFRSDDSIRAKITEAIEKDQVDIDKAFKDKKLTGPQRDILTALLGQIKQSEIDKALGDFNKERMAAQKRIDDELDNLIQQDAKERADLIPEDFDRQNALLDMEYQKQADALQRAKEGLLKKNADDANAGLIDQDAALKNIQIIEAIYAKLFADLGLLIQKKKANLSLSLFDQALSFDKTGFSKQEAAEAERVEQQVTKLTAAYMRGQLTYDRYQKTLTNILANSSNRRRQLNIAELQDELDLQQRKLDSAQGVVSAKELDAIEKRIADLRAQIAQLKQEGAQAGVTQSKAEKDNFIESMRKKISAIQQFSSAGLQAYQTITQAQEDQVSRDIELQQYRVSRAQAIADRGNAKALQAEEDRLNELQKAREKFARTQMAINAAQTLSQSVLAIASAAGESGAGAIVIVPAVIAALAAGFAAVKALSSDAQGFRDGVVGLNGRGTTKSDSIPANLSRGESVVTAAGTAPHREILEGMNAGRHYRLIDHRKILEMTPGNTVANLHPIPLSGITVINTGSGMDTKNMEKRLAAIEKAVQAIPATSVTIDEHGLAASMQKVIHRQNLLKKL